MLTLNRICTVHDPDYGIVGQIIMLMCHCLISRYYMYSGSARLNGDCEQSTSECRGTVDVVLLMRGGLLAS